MGIYYEILRPVNNDDLSKVDLETAAILKGLPPGGYVDAGKLDARGRGALERAASCGITQKTRIGDRIMGLESVRFWISQLNPTRLRNFSPSKGTKDTYAEALDSFDGWLRGRGLPVKRGAARHASRAFSDVEDLLRFCEDSDRGILTARRALRQYLAESADSGTSLSTVLVRASAIRSYFAAHDVTVDVRVNRNRHATGKVREDSGMGLPDLYKMMVFGGMDAMMRAIVMVKFQAGLDSSTLADRFNFEAYGQIVRHFGIEDHDAWDLDRCPVPIRLVRVKTGMRYTTFIDRDAVSCLQEYLRWREVRRKKYDGTGPLFVTRRGTPVRPAWISARFSKAAANAGIQRRVSDHFFKVRSHEVRDLLKSTLIVSGCAQHVADHVLGHAPRDSYEKQATLYPEEMRAEYSKASGRLNIFTRIERCLAMPDGDNGGGGMSGNRPGGPGAGGGGGNNDGDDGRYQTLEARQMEMQDTLQKMAGALSDLLRFMQSSAGKTGVPDGPLRGLADPGDGSSSSSSSSSSNNNNNNSNSNSNSNNNSGDPDRR